MPPGIDCIGALPDEILHHILSFLPAQEAVQTCVLAHRWRHLWKSTTGLRIVGTKDPISVHVLRKFVDHLLILRERTELDTVEIGFRQFRGVDVPFVNLWVRFAVQSKVRALTVSHYDCNRPFNLDVLPFVSPYLRTLVLSGVGLQGTFLDFSTCPALEYLTITFSAINVDKISSLSLKRLNILGCRSYRDDRVRVSAPCLVSLKLIGFSGLTPLLESMPMLETAFLSLGTHGHLTSQDICQKYNQSGVYCGANHDACPNCHANNDGSTNCVVLGAISNAKHLVLRSSFEMIVFTRDLKWCPTFINKLKNLILNDYWCVGPSFDALSCILKHSPVLEKLSLQLIKGQTANVKMKGSYSSMERSSVISDHLKDSVSCKGEKKHLTVDLPSLDSPIIECFSRM